MVNLNDIARGAHNGAWFEAMSRQFAIDPALAQKAVEALLPAFTVAFQRNAMNPLDFANLLGMVGSGRFAPFYDAAASAPPRPAAESLLAQLFGSKQATDAIAAQASAMTGVGVQLFQQMMPTIAATLVGGMFRYATVEGFADLLRQWSDALKAAQPGAPPKPETRPQDPWSAWVSAVGAMTGAAQTPPPDPTSPWSDMMAAFLGGGATAPPPPPPSRPDPFAAVLQMFDTGREVQAQYAANLRKILLAGDTDGSKPAP